ncbi:MAG: right-handed parallel beta-helix repeat-containing protein, partial [Deltaproteobacteria bacterium]|nr:right-handed parallel beta-helix repeat-containing protein [Deltaproteobacteria bacterium]
MEPQAGGWLLSTCELATLPCVQSFAPSIVQGCAAWPRTHRGRFRLPSGHFPHSAEADLKVIHRITPSVLALVLLVPGAVRAADFYVSLTGSDTNPGTLDQPFRTVGRGQTAAAAGDTVFIRGGVYTIAGTSGTMGINFTKSGQPDRRINYFAYPNETPIFDLFGLLPNARVTGFNVACSWIHIRGLELRGVQQIVTGDSWGVRIQGSNNLIERLNVHHGEAPGFFITSGANNLILNCDSHHNYDPLEGGGNGDGFGCHSDDGGNVISGCRGYANSDDGFDFISAARSCTAEKSWAFTNGWIPDTTQGAGNGAGFKSGGFGTDTGTFPAVIPRHTIRQCVAFGNRSQGFYANHHPGGIDFLNNTAFRNQSNFDMLADVGTSSHKIRNNIAMGMGGTINRLTGGTATFNSWNLPVTVSADDFMNVAEAEALAPRQADGSLPNVGFMRLVATSDLIDKGENVGLAFAGAAPDLGAYESGLLTTGSGGASGSGGAGVGGRTGSGGAATGGAMSSGTGGGAGPATGGGSVST